MKFFTRPAGGLFLAVLALGLGACQEGGTSQEHQVARRVAPLFNNGGFESGVFAPDWTVSTYRNLTGLANPPWPPASEPNLNLSSGGTNLTSIVTNPTPESQLFAGMVAAPGVPRWPKFGASSVVINSQGLNGNVNTLRQSYPVGSSDVDPVDGKVHIRFLLAPALQAAGHVQEQQPYFFVAVRNQTAPRVGDLYTSFNFSNSPGTPWQSQGAGATAVLYTDWTIFDIAPGNIALRVGDTVQVEVYAGGCQPSGHWGEVYVDGFGATFPGLSIAKTAPAMTNIDTDLTYAFTAKNNTPGAAPSVTADEVLPPNTTFVSLTAPVGAICTTPAVGATGTVSCNFGWMNPGASNNFQVTVHVYTPVSKGTATAGSATTLTDSSKAWAVDAWVGYSLYITAGTGAGQQRVVRSNTATVLTLSTAWTTNPDATSLYAVVDAPAAQRIATAGANATLTDSTQAWTANQWSGWTLYIVAGTGAGQQRDITSNTGTVLTVVSNWATNPNATSVYAIKRSAKVTNGNFGIMASTITRTLGPKVETAITGGVPYVDLAITKTDSVPAVNWNGTLQYRIAVTNNGPVAVTNALVTDTLPAQLVANAPWTCSGTGGGTCTASGTGNLNQAVNLPVGATVTFLVNGTVINGAGNSSMSNIATVAPPAGFTDNFPSNNSDIDIDGIGPLFVLTANKGSGETGQGTITSSPAAISCGPACTSATASFISGTDVTLTAVARPGDTFTGWTGACTGTAIACTFTVTAATTATAHFKGLDVIGSAASGNGSVTCVPSDVAQGGSSVCTIAPNAGFALTVLTDNGTNVTASVSLNTFTLTNVLVNHSVVGTFLPLPLTPTITAPVNGSTTGNNKPPISGTTSPGVTVTVKVDGLTVCTAIANGTGAFSCVPTVALLDGARSATATATNANGTTPPSSAVNFTVDTVAPAAPVVTTPANGSSTNLVRPPISGTAEAGSTVTVTLDGVVAGSAIANGAGAWTFTPGANLSQAVHLVSVRATDAGGNVSAISNVNSFTVDTTAPDTSIVTGPPAQTFLNTATFSFSSTESGGSYECSLDGVAFAVCTNPVTFSSVTTGIHTLQVRTRDAAGNPDLTPAQQSWEVVLDTAIVSGPSGLTNNPSATFSFSSPNSAITYECSLDGAGFAACPNPSTLSGLADGTHSLRVRSRDSLGNFDTTPALRSWVVDTVPPSAPVISSPADQAVIGYAAPIITGTGEPGSTVTVRLDGVVAGTALVNASGDWTFTPGTALTAGLHTVSATAADPAGNPGPGSATHTFTVDLTALDTTIVTGPSGSTNSTSATFSFSSNKSGVTYECSLDGAAFVACLTPSTFAALAQGPHTFQVRAKDSLGAVDSSPASRSWTVDTLAPSAPVVTTPANGSTIGTALPSYSGTAEANSTVTVLVDNAVVGTTVASATGSWSFVPGAALTSGSHNVRARATDAAGNISVDSAVNTFTVNPAILDTFIISGPNLKSALSTGAFDLASNQSPVTYECQLDAAAYVACSDPATFVGLSEGSHTLLARAKDGLGNVDATPASFTWAVDTLAPDTTIVSGPPAQSLATSATFDFSSTEAGVSYECSVDGGAFAPCLNPVTFGPLAVGLHTLAVRARDATGNLDASPATYNWQVLGPLDTVIVSGPPAVSNSPSAAFTFSSPNSNVTYECSLDGSAFATCATPSTFSALGDGAHTLRVRAKDALGNFDTSPALHRWVVDTLPPAAPVITSPADNSTIGFTTPSITGSSEPGATVTVSVDGVVIGTTVADSSGNWSFTPTTPLASGPHTLSARATDPAGNIGPSSATNAFAIDPNALDTAIVTGPSGSTSSTSAAFSFTSNVAGVTYECSLDGAAFTACSNPASLSALAEGPHTLQVRAKDSGGAVDATPAARGWTVDTVVPTAPVVTTPANGSTIGTAVPTISGTAEPLSTVTVLIDGVVAGTTPANATGGWSFVPAAPLSLGSHTAAARSTDAAGNVSPSSAINTFTLDSATLDTFIVSGPNPFSRLSTAAFDLDSNRSNVTYECKLDGGAFVACSDPATFAGLTDGNHTLLVRARDSLGNVDSTPASFSWTLDTVAPDTTVVSGPPAQTFSSWATFDFSSNESGVTYECSLDGAVFTSCGDPSTFGPMAAGVHTLLVRTRDAAGNVDPTPTQLTWEVVLETVIVTGPAALTNSTSASFTFSSPNTGVTYECSLDGAVFIACANPSMFNGLADGVHSLRVRVKDGLGNFDTTPALRFWTIDTLVPGAPVVTSPGDQAVIGYDTPIITGTGQPGSTVTVRLDGGAAGTALVDPSGHWTFTPAAPLSSGMHTVSATATDPAGNLSPSSATHSFTVDLSALDTAIVSGPSGSTSSTSAIFTYGSNKSGVTYECSFDGAAFTSCSNPQLLSALADGTHTLQVRAKDAGGTVDSTPASRTWTVDTVAPSAPVVPSPSDGSTIGTTMPTISGTAEPFSTVTVLIDGVVAGTTTADASGNWTFVPATPLTPGSHTVAAQSTDAAGNVSPSSAINTFTVDTGTLDTFIVSGPNLLSRVSTAAFDLDSNRSNVTYECSLDGAAFSACNDPATFLSLPDGSHTLRVRATTGAGIVDATPASFTWTIDTVTPDTTIVSGPPAQTLATSAKFDFSSTEAGVSYECSLDGGPFVTCSNPVTFGPLGVGMHTLAVRARDPVGNVDPTPAQHVWAVMPVLDTVIVSGPPATSKSAGAMFSFSSPNASVTYECSLDGAAFTACANPSTFSALADGAHTLRVRARDAAGNFDTTPALHAWVIDTAAPAAPVVVSPADESTLGYDRPVISGTGEPGATLTVILDGMIAGTTVVDPSGNWSFTPAAPLASGLHTVSANATDPAGNVGPSSSPNSFTVDLGILDTTIVSGPSGSTGSASATFAFGSNQTGVTYECSLDGAAFTACTNPSTFGALAQGTHTVAVRAKSAAGTVDPTPATRTWTVDTVVPAGPVVVTPANNSTIGTTRPTITGSAEPLSTVTVMIDGMVAGTTTANASGDWTFVPAAPLSLGNHTVGARATDAAGNVSPASAINTFTIDTATLDTFIVTGPNQVSRLTDAAFDLDSNRSNVTYECSLDGAAFTACSDPATFTGLADGSHTVQVRAKDSLGNVDATPASFSWVVDTRAPAAPVVTSPANGSTVTNNRPPVTGTSEPGARVRVSIDGQFVGIATADATGKWTQPLGTALSNGPHTVSATATDAAGNVSPASATNSFTVVTQMPMPMAPTITSPTNGASTGNRTPTITGKGPLNSKVDVFVDGVLVGSTTTDANGDWSFTPTTAISDGSHVITAQASQGGLRSPSSAPVMITVDTTAPDTRIVTSPPAANRAATAAFTFGSDDPASTYECSLDGADFVACNQAQSFSGLAAGSHLLEVRAVDAAGNKDPTPASYLWSQTQATQLLSGGGCGCSTVDPGALLGLLGGLLLSRRRRGPARG